MNPIFPILIVSFLIGALLLALWRIRKLEQELKERDALLSALLRTPLGRDALVAAQMLTTLTPKASANFQGKGPDAKPRGAEAHTP